MDAASSEGIVHKLSDEARRQQPFDAFLLKEVPAYVVACFTARHARVCYLIDANEWSGARFNMLEGYKCKIEL